MVAITQNDQNDTLFPFVRAGHKKANGTVKYCIQNTNYKNKNYFKSFQDVVRNFYLQYFFGEIEQTELKLNSEAACRTIIVMLRTSSLHFTIVFWGGFFSPFWYRVICIPKWKLESSLTSECKNAGIIFVRPNEIGSWLCWQERDTVHAVQGSMLYIRRRMDGWIDRQIDR